MNIRDTLVRNRIYAKYDGHCAYCGCELEFEEFTVDHIIPQSRLKIL